MKHRTRLALTMLGLVVFSGSPVVAYSPTAQQKPSSSVVNRWLHSTARNSAFLRIRGNGPLWKKNTGIKDESVGLEVHDKRLIQSLTDNFRTTGKVREVDDVDDMHGDNGFIEVDFSCRPLKFQRPWYEDDVQVYAIEYKRHGARAFDIIDYAQSWIVSVQSGYERRFEGSIRRIAKVARRHDGRVAYWAVEGD